MNNPSVSTAHHHHLNAYGRDLTQDLIKKQNMSKASLHELPSGPTDAISSVSFSPRSAPLLIASSWDTTVRLYDISKASSAGENAELVKFSHVAPVLDCCWGATDTEVYSGGLDWQVKQYVILSPPPIFPVMITPKRHHKAKKREDKKKKKEK